MCPGRANTRPRSIASNVDWESFKYLKENDNNNNNKTIILIFRENCNGEMIVT